MLLEYMLCLLVSILLSSMISVLFFQVQKTTLMLKNNIAQQQEISFFYHYFLQTISMSGVNGLHFSDYLLTIHPGWPVSLKMSQPGNFSGGDVLSIEGTEPKNSYVLIHDNSNKIILESNEPFYQDGDKILLSNGQEHEVFTIISVTHYYVKNTQRLILDAKVKIPMAEKLLAYPILHNVFYLGSTANGKRGLFVMHMNGRHELIMSFISEWHLKLIQLNHKNEIFIRAEFNRQKTINFIFGQDNE